MVDIPWTGYLALPRLGLADAQWETLCGRGPAPFDAIIYNGAAVHWVYDYGRLCGPNVQGTLSLLTALAHSSAPMHFTYVSALQPGSDTVPDGDEGYPDDPSLTDGYTQTKYVSKMRISRFAKQRAGQHAVAIVRPGLMIGSPTDGIANTDDVIWCTMAAAIEIGAYNCDEDDAWLYVAPVDSVAAVIIHETLYCSRGLEEGPIALTSIEDRLFIKDFWYAIRYATMQSLDSLAGTLWWNRIKAQVKTGGQSHSLWPVMDFIETTAGRLGLPTKGTMLQLASLSTMIWMAVVRNAQYLCSLGAMLGSTERSAGLFDRISGRSWFSL